MKDEINTREFDGDTDEAARVTSSELAGLAVDLTRRLFEAQCDRDGWRLVALGAIDRATELSRELTGERKRRHRLLDERRDDRRRQQAEAA